VIESQIDGHPVLTQQSDGTVVVSSRNTSNGNQVWRPSKLGPVWRAWLTTNGLRRMGLNTTGQLITGTEPWSLYQGRLGAFTTNTVDGGESVDGHTLTPTEQAQAQVITTALQADFKANPSDAEGAPSEALGARKAFPGNDMSPVLPYSISSSDKWVVFRSQVSPIASFVLSLSISDPHTVVARSYIAGDATQVWRKKEMSNTTNQSFILYSANTGDVLTVPSGQQSIYTYPAGCVAQNGDFTFWNIPSTQNPITGGANVVADEGNHDQCWNVNVLGAPLLTSQYPINVTTAVSPVIPSQLWLLQEVDPLH